MAVSVFITRLWLAHPGLFPEFPKPIAEYFVHLYGAQNAEQVADLELLIGFSISIPFVSTITGLAWWLWRRLAR